MFEIQRMNLDFATVTQSEGITSTTITLIIISTIIMLVLFFVASIGILVYKRRKTKIRGNDV